MIFKMFFSTFVLREMWAACNRCDNCCSCCKKKKEAYHSGPGHTLLKKV
jgi:hypothetical protein